MVSLTVMSLDCPDDQFLDAVSKPVLPNCGFVLTQLVVPVLAHLKGLMSGAWGEREGGGREGGKREWQGERREKEIQREKGERVKGGSI